MSKAHLSKGFLSTDNWAESALPGLATYWNVSNLPVVRSEKNSKESLKKCPKICSFVLVSLNFILEQGNHGQSQMFWSVPQRDSTSMSGKNRTQGAPWLSSGAAQQWIILTPRDADKDGIRSFPRPLVHPSGGLLSSPDFWDLLLSPWSKTLCEDSRDVLIKIRECRTQWKPVWRSVEPRVTNWSNKSRKPVELWLWANWQKHWHVGGYLTKSLLF